MADIILHTYFRYFNNSKYYLKCGLIKYLSGERGAKQDEVDNTQIIFSGPRLMIEFSSNSKLVLTSSPSKILSMTTHSKPKNK